MISTTLETLRADLASKINAKVFIGAPDDNEPGRYIFPIYHGISPALHSVGSAPETRARRPGHSLECLMLAAPAGNFDAMDEGASFIHEHPILEIDGTMARLSVSDESPVEAASIFMAAGISYRLYTRFRIRIEPVPARR